MGDCGWERATPCAVAVNQSPIVNLHPSINLHSQIVHPEILRYLRIHPVEHSRIRNGLAQVFQSAAVNFLNSEHPPQSAADKELQEFWPEPAIIRRNKDVWFLNDDIIHGGRLEMASRRNLI